MNIIVSAKTFKLSDYLVEYVEKKLEKLARLVPKDTDVKVELDHDHNQHTGLVFRVEVSLHLGKTVIKAGEKAEHMNEAIDLCVPKLVHHVVKFKDKLRTKQRSTR